MDVGELITILFWGAVILFSILQSVAQQKKQREAEGEGAEGFEFPEADESAEGMVPEDLWEEITGASPGGRREARSSDSPAAPVESSPDRSAREVPVSYDDAAESADEPPTRQELERRARRLEADVGAGTSLGRPIGSGTAHSRTGGRGGSELLGELTGDDLKRAFVLHEVLAPPVSQRKGGRGGR